MFPSRWPLSILCACVVALAQPTMAQNASPPADPAAQPAGAPAQPPADPAAAPPVDPNAPPVAEREPLRARVIDVTGDVEWGTLGKPGWTPVAVGDEYLEGTQLRTGIRSSVKLTIIDRGTITAVLVDSAGKIAIRELARTAEAQRTRLELGYGQIRAGVAEGATRSDFSIDTPVATLSKRGTRGIRVFFERGTERLDVSLAEEGLLELYSRITGRTITIQPGERATEAARMYLDEALFENVPIPDILGQGDIDVAFWRLRTDGLGVVNTGQGRAVLIDLTNASAKSSFARLVTRSLQPLPVPAPLPGAQPIVPLRPEGTFGTGRGDDLVDVFIGLNSPLAQRGLAQPGTYKFPRRVLEGWLREHRAR